MTDHHAADSVSELLKDRKFCSVQFVSASIDARQLMMGIQRRGGVTGKVLSAGLDPGFQQGLVECAGEIDDLLHRTPITSTTKGVIGLVIKRNIQDRAEIQVEPEKTEQFSCQPSMFPNQTGIAFFSELLCVGRFVADQFEP